MSLNAQDFHNYEAYKKAMRAASGHIGNNTPFCLFSDVQLPDAAHKVHIFKPFLVVGAPASTIAPFLRDLHGSKQISAGGVCSIEDGKISLEAKSGTLNFALLKSQESIFKDVLGKEILIPGTGGGPASSTVEPEPVEDLHTAIGHFRIFSRDRAKHVMDIKSIESAVGQLVSTRQKSEAMHVDHRDAVDLGKKLPSGAEIHASATKPDAATSAAARGAQKSMTDLFSTLSRLDEVNDAVDLADKNVSISIAKLHALDLDEQGLSLRRRIEQEKDTIDAVFGFLKTASDVGLKIKALKKLAETAELLPNVIELVGNAVSKAETADLTKQAEEIEKEAIRLKLSIGNDEHQQAQQAVINLVKAKRNVSRELLLRLDDVRRSVQATKDAFDNRPGNHFKFRDLQAAADKMASARDRAKAVQHECDQISATATPILAVLVTGKWKLPWPDEGENFIAGIKVDCDEMRKDAGEILKDAERRIVEWTLMYNEVEKEIPT